MQEGLHCGDVYDSEKTDWQEPKCPLVADRLSTAVPRTMEQHTGRKRAQHRSLGGRRVQGYWPSQPGEPFMLRALALVLDSVSAGGGRSSRGEQFKRTKRRKGAEGQAWLGLQVPGKGQTSGEGC